MDTNRALQDTSDPGGPLREDDGPLEQRSYDAESAYPNNDQPAAPEDGD